jgi:sugar phosphate isomerase/epimerase
MLNLAVFTDEVSQDPEKAVRLALKAGLQGLEIRSVWDTQPQDLSASQITELKRLLEAHELKVCCISSPFLKCKLWDEEACKHHLDILRRCISLAKSLGTNLIRGFTCWKTGDTPEVWAEVERLYHEVTPILDAEEILLGIENEHDTNASTAASLARFLERLNHPRVRAVWDPANEIFADNGDTPYPDGYLRLKPYVVHVHAKDAFRAKDGKPQVALLGDGAIDWKGQLKALTDDGYKGYVSVETHWKMIELPADLLARCGERTFSRVGEEASRASVAALVKMAGMG